MDAAGDSTARRRAPIPARIPPERPTGIRDEDKARRSLRHPSGQSVETRLGTHRRHQYGHNDPQRDRPAPERMFDQPAVMSFPFFRRHGVNHKNALTRATPLATPRRKTTSHPQDVFARPHVTQMSFMRQSPCWRRRQRADPPE